LDAKRKDQGRYSVIQCKPVQIEEETEGIMSLFCEKCNNRRLPKWIKEENKTHWLCETCDNYVDGENNIIVKEV
jgi:hypothetical protein